MTTLLSNFVEKVQSKHWQNLRRRTQKLDLEEKGNLLVLLEDNLSAPQQQQTITENKDSASNHNNSNHDDSDDDDEFAEEDYELLQRDLDKANLRLEELQSKHDFLRTRLETYRAKIQAAEDRCSSNTNDMKKIASYKEALKPVEATFENLSKELAQHQQKIESMQDRQLELKLKTQECQVVLDELCHSLEASARLPYQDHDQEIVAQIQEEDEPKEEDVKEKGGEENNQEEEP